MSWILAEGHICKYQFPLCSTLLNRGVMLRDRARRDAAKQTEVRCCSADKTFTERIHIYHLLSLLGAVVILKSPHLVSRRPRQYLLASSWLPFCPLLTE